MPNRPRSHQIPPESPEYTAAWARDLIASIGKRQARQILADYRARADDPEVTKHGRDVAAERAETLERLL